LSGDNSLSLRTPNVNGNTQETPGRTAFRGADLLEPRGLRGPPFSFWPARFRKKRAEARTTSTE
jgi:hypothetical protein